MGTRTLRSKQEKRKWRRLGRSVLFTFTRMWCWLPFTLSDDKREYKFLHINNKLSFLYIVHMIRERWVRDGEEVRTFIHLSQPSIIITMCDVGGWDIRLKTCGAFVFTFLFFFVFFLSFFLQIRQSHTLCAHNTHPIDVFFIYIYSDFVNKQQSHMNTKCTHLHVIPQNIHIIHSCD